MRRDQTRRRYGPRPAMLLFCLLLAASVARAQTTPLGFKAAKLAEIDSAITNAIADKKLPGGVLWLERRGQVYHRAYGQRSLAPAPESMTEDTIFDLASLTKVVATTPAMMLLIERGQVKLDEPVQSYLPEFKGDSKETITIRHLMTHSSGLPAGFTHTYSSEGLE